MKKLLKRLALMVIILAAGTVVLDYHYTHDKQPVNPNHAATAQAKFSHMLDFLSKTGESEAHCTGTAIGPHAILTALHCDENAEYLQIKIDYSPRHYKVLTGVVDGRDHLILLIDGPALTNIDPYVLRAPKQGEPVYIYGFGQAQYPATRKEGVVVAEYDPSEVNAAAGLFYTSTVAIPGDSGAAIYGADGAILGILTYRITDEGMLFDKTEAGNFQLTYDAETITNVQKFQPPKEDSDVEHTERTPVQPKYTARATDGAVSSKP